MSAEVQAPAVTAEVVVAIVTDVLASLGVETVELPHEPPSAAHWTASVGVTGTWGGHVTVSCSPETAAALTSTMLGLEPGEASQEDVADAVGELANMVGGSVKGMLPPPNTLSLPHVVLAAGSHHFPHATTVCSVALAAPHGPLLVDVRTSTTP
ncbi:chemotaxis protein CheX [Vallicoccus soli]|uniref:Chemotaxis protein CheX n=1 Tax=Vallicoccus soli TaxID=2339232 RepID=A0A3A3YPF1_9ACTN|nr:chemotaxis protein CheX [Vallicoccus soli]RJK92451.1 chemotaxis protein CheX [Vallicoccus soli]